MCCKWLWRISSARWLNNTNKPCLIGRSSVPPPNPLALASTSRTCGTWSTPFCPSPWKTTTGNQGGPAETGRCLNPSCSTPKATRSTSATLSEVRLAPLTLIRYSQIFTAKISNSILINCILVIGLGVHLSHYSSCCCVFNSRCIWWWSTREQGIG